jgi:small subunit ribosomal protein S8e
MPEGAASVGVNLADTTPPRSERFKCVPGVSRRMQDQGRSTRKRTGGRRRPSRKKKRHQLGREPAETTVGEPRLRTVDRRGTGTKTRALSTNVAQIAVDGETVTAEIENVVENPANTNYARRNILTKGAVIETSEGRGRVTSRPGQTGQVNAVLLD